MYKTTLLIAGMVLTLAFGFMPVAFATSFAGDSLMDRADIDPSGALHFNANIFGRNDAFNSARGGHDRDADIMYGPAGSFQTYGLGGNYWYWGEP